MTSRKILGIALTLTLGVGGAQSAAAESVKIGFISTFTGPSGVVGQHMYNGFMLGIDHAGGKLGGLTTEVIKVDDQLKPEIAVKVTKDLLERDKVNFITGVIFSNIMFAIHKPIVESETFFISANAGPGPMAGERCSPYFFASSFQQDTLDESMGRYLNEKGVKKVYFLAPNYVAGRSAGEAFKRTFKGEIVGEVYTRMDQLDYSAELAQMKASGVDSAYIFMPGGFGINFLKQFHQAGLRSTIKLYSKSTVDGTTLAAQGEAAIGSFDVAHWTPDLDNAANKKFVADYKKKYGDLPSFYGEAAYDAAQLLQSALSAVKGNLKDKDGIRAALRQAKIESPRGPFKFNRNHLPIQNMYLFEVVKGAQGPELVNRGVVKDVVDSYVDKCPMKW